MHPLTSTMSTFFYWPHNLKLLSTAVIIERVGSSFAIYTFLFISLFSKPMQTGIKPNTVTLSEPWLVNLLLLLSL